MTASSEFQFVFTSLKRILALYSDNLVVVIDQEGEFYLNTKFIMNNKKPMYFGSVKISKNYVTFHLMPIYVFPSLLKTISPGLKKRMQGKSCFNFTSVDPVLIAELDQLTKKGFIEYQKSGYV